LSILEVGLLTAKTRAPFGVLIEKVKVSRVIFSASLIKILSIRLCAGELLKGVKVKNNINKICDIKFFKIIEHLTRTKTNGKTCAVILQIKIFPPQRKKPQTNLGSDDEKWLRAKINAEKEINLDLLLEIRFLEVVKDEKGVKKQLTR